MARKKRFNIGKWARAHPKKMARARRKGLRTRSGHHSRPHDHSRKWERTVRAIKRSGTAENPYAVATWRLGPRSFVHHSRRGLNLLGRLIQRAMGKPLTPINFHHWHEQICPICRMRPVLEGK